MKRRDRLQGDLSDALLRSQRPESAPADPVHARGQARAVGGRVEPLTTVARNNLPDSAFLYIAPGGEKDAEGKTKPRSLRKFPVYNAQGNPDPSHIRNALARLGDPKSDIPASARAAAKRKAEQLLERVNAR